MKEGREVSWWREDILKVREGLFISVGGREVASSDGRLRMLRDPIMK